jgi:superfamily I DNA/RNA helicase/CRISPR/Cas system-associated exonuclease Cas4 (RecB family)
MDDRVTITATELLRNTEGHARILGPPASGKTSLLLDRFRQLEQDGGAGRIAVVTYTRESRDVLLSRLLPENSARFGAAPVYTWHQLAMLIIRACSRGNRRLVGELEQAVLLRRAIRRIEGRLVSDFRAAARSTTFQKTVLGVANVLMQNGADTQPESSPGAPPRVIDLLAICSEFQALLRATGCFTFYDAAWIAARLLAGTPGKNPLGTTCLLVDDFQDVDPGQYALITALAPPRGDIRVNVFGDPTGARFRFRGTTDRYLLDLFPRQYDAADIVLYPHRGESAGLDRVADRLIRETGCEVSGGGRGGAGTGGVEVVQKVAGNEQQEAAWIADSAVSLIGEGGFAAGDIAVAVREKHRYESTLVKAFRDRGLALDTGRPAGHPFVFFVNSLLRLIDGRDTAGNAVTASPFYRDLVELYRRNTGEAAGSPELIRDAMIRTAQPAGGRGGFDLKPLLAEWVQPLLLGAGLEDRSEELLLFLGALETEWRQYCDIADESGGRRALPEFLSLSRVLSGENGRARLVGRVGLYSCHELSALRYPVVFLAGCSDLLFPAPPPRQNYIPWKQLQDTLNARRPENPVELPAARTPREFLRDEYALLLTSLARARSRLIITAPENFRGLATPAPARVLEGLGEDRLPDADGSSPYLRFASEMAAAGADKAQTGLRVADLWHRPTPPGIGIRLKLKRLSPTTIKMFTTCPTQAFYSRILRVDEERSPGVAFGSLFHDLMNRLSEHYRTHVELGAVIRSVRLDEHITKTMEDSDYFNTATEVERTAARYHLRDMATRFLEIDEKRTDNYYITQSEKQVGFEWQGWGFGGVADRVDRIQGGTYVVIDYKTGAVKKTGATIRRHSLPGFDKPDDRLWQVPLYTRGARPGDAILPGMFCYYVIQPGGDSYPVGLVIGEETDKNKIRSIFGGAEPKRFSYLTRDELNACLDEAAGIAADIFAERTVFDRTANRDRCARCFYKRVCERTV